MFGLRFYNVLLNQVSRLLNTLITPVLPEVTAEVTNAPMPKRRKVSDTTKYNLEQRYEIWLRYQRYLEYNKSNPKDRMTFSQLVQGINHSFGTHKSSAAIMLVIKDMEPLTDNLPSSSSTQECA